MVVSDQVDAGTVAWGVPSAHVKFVTRKGTKVEKFPNVQRDGIWLRAVSRLGVAFVNEPGVTRLVVAHRVHAELRWRYGGTATVKVNNLGASATIAFNAANSAVKTAIVGIDDSILAADVTVTGSAGVYTVTVPGVLTVDGTSLTGGTAASVTLV